MLQRLRNLWLPPFEIDSEISWHEATLHAWQWVTPWDGSPPDDIHFYVDGSSVFNPGNGARQAGAATALVLTSPFGTWWGGLQARKVEGAATSPHAEAAALLQAILWAHSLLNQFPALAQSRFHFWGDSIGPREIGCPRRISRKWTPAGSSFTGSRKEFGMAAVGTMYKPTQDAHGMSVLTWLPMQQPKRDRAGLPSLICGMRSSTMTQTR